MDRSLISTSIGVDILNKAGKIETDFDPGISFLGAEAISFAADYQGEASSRNYCL